MISDLNLVDPWRIYNSEAKTFTWHRKNPVKMARLDFYLISEELLSRVDNISIKNGYRTDHSMVLLDIRITDFKKGGGFWKFNTSLLKDQIFVNKVKEIITLTREEYMIEISESDEDFELSIPADLFLETLLMKIREMTIHYSSKLKESRNKEFNCLINQINFVKELYDESHNEVIGDILDDLNKNFEEYRRYKLEGIILRTRSKWIEEGERPSKYFCSLEKRNFINKNITKIINNDNKTITDQEDILYEVENFYKTLYKSQDDNLEDIDLNSIVNESTIPKLTDAEKHMLDSPITETEILDSLKKLKNKKSPGTTGFQADFYKFFWKDLKYFILRSFYCSLSKGELSQSQKLGIVSILPKGEKPREYLKNWRPITLLNTLYKIFSGIIANRLKLVLHKLIHENQKGFLAGRFIGENTRLMYDILYQTEILNKPGMVLLLDFEKAFDSVSWQYIEKVLKFFNFGSFFINLVKIIFCDVQLCVIQHGFFSKFFRIGRGCRQGDPASPYIFLLCVEIMGIMIRENKDISGLNLFNKEYKLLQYADDTSLLLDGSEKSLNAALTLVYQFSKFSGLKPYYDKTFCIKIGSLKQEEVVFEVAYNIQWSQEPFQVLGITFTPDLSNINELNYRVKLNSIRKTISSWSKRNLSTIGRITVVKSILIPKLTHLFMALPNPDRKYLKELNTLLFNYIWNSKVDRVARTVVTKKFMDGGLNMVNLELFIKSLKLTWIRRLECSNTSWGGLLFSSMPDIFKNYILVGNQLIHRLLKNLNPFWRDVFSSLMDLREIVKDKVLETPLWYNELIKIDYKCVYSMYLDGLKKA